MGTEIAEIESYKNWLGIHRMSVAQLAEAMGESALVLQRIFDSGGIDNIFLLCQIDQFCTLFDQTKAAQQNHHSGFASIIAWWKGASYYIPAAQQAYRVWMRQMNTSKAREKAVRVYLNAPWREGSDVYIKMVTNLEQPTRTYFPEQVGSGL